MFELRTLNHLFHIDVYCYLLRFAALVSHVNPTTLLKTLLFRAAGIEEFHLTALTVGKLDISRDIA